MTNHRAIPPAVKVYPNIVLAGKRQRVAGGIRLWTVARGMGTVVDPLELRSLVGSRRYKRWLPQALRTGALDFWGDNLHVLSLVKLSLRLGSPPGTPGLISLRDFLQPGYLASVWGLLLASHDGPISRKSLAELYSVPESTQRLYEDGIPGLKIQRHLGRWTPPGSAWAWAAEFRQGEHPGAFVKGQDVAWPLPNSYSLPAMLLPRGLSKRAAHIIRAGRDLPSGETRRLFHSRKAGAESARRNYGSEVTETYYRTRGYWRAVS